MCDTHTHSMRGLHRPSHFRHGAAHCGTIGGFSQRDSGSARPSQGRHVGLTITVHGGHSHGRPQPRQIQILILISPNYSLI